MSLKYKYLFRFGRGPKALDLLGPSLSHFWNDIYDMFDLHREMFVEKLDGSAFSVAEIKRLFRELSEDMEEDFAEILLEIQNGGKRLRFLEMNILPGLALDEQEELLREYASHLEQSRLVLSTSEFRILHFPERDTIVLFVDMGVYEKNEVDAEKIRTLLNISHELGVNKQWLVTWNDISSEAKSIIEESKIEMLNSGKMLKEINERNLDIALDALRCNTGVEEKFTKEGFRIYLDRVRSATTNLVKKNSLEDLSKYLLSGVEGFRVMNKDYRGPSEEIDLLVANESKDTVLNVIGNPIAVECRHRRKPANSKEIRDFRGKLADMGLKGGILITLQGVTGNRFDAVATIREARKNGTSIIVVAVEDLRKIREGRTPTQILKECFYKYV